jgi:hypothetical protein
LPGAEAVDQVLFGWFVDEAGEFPFGFGGGVAVQAEPESGFDGVVHVFDYLVSVGRAQEDRPTNSRLFVPDLNGRLSWGL